jgi:hypothetical protein
VAIDFQPELRLMSLPSSGITADVIRDIMPPYHLSADLLDGTFARCPRRRKTPPRPGGTPTSPA